MDKYLLKALTNRARYLSLRNSVPEEMVASATKRLLNEFGEYYEKYPDHDDIDLEALITQITLRKGQTADNRTILCQLIKQLEQPVPDEILANTVNQLESLAFAGKAQLLLQKFSAGEEVDITHELMVLSQTTRQRMQIQSQASWADGDVWEYIQKDADDSGYVLDVFPEIADNLKGLNAGDNVCIAAPTDKGKTSILCNVAVTFAKQEWAAHGEDSRPVLYMVNEGMAERITPRVYQTALHCTRAELWKKGQEGTITDDYVRVVGRRDMIRLVNIHGMSVAQVARVIEQHNPFCVITDMTGRIKVGTGGGMNDVQQLEQVWDDFRSLAAIHKFIHVGTAQISAEGMDNPYPPLTAIQNSKVGIQTTWDLGVFIGALANPDMGTENLRWISTPKNKLARSGKKAQNKVEVIFEPEKNTWS